MVDIMNKFFGKSKSSDKGEPLNHDIYVATCALFLEMASIDGEFTDSERDNIVSILSDEYNLSEQSIKELLITSQAEREGSIDLWKFTNKINQNYSIEEKIRIIELIWKIVYADGKLEKHEDYLIHKIARLLNLKHSELIEAKLNVLHEEEK